MTHTVPPTPAGSRHPGRLLRAAALLAVGLVFSPAPAFASEGLNGASLSLLWALPFAGILLCIATGPVLYPHLWEHHYGKFAALWAALVVIPLFLVVDPHTVAATLTHTVLLEYVPFILLLLALSKYLGVMHKNGVRVRIVGDRTDIAAHVREASDHAENSTKHNTRITLLASDR
eukprot:gene337-480_t